MQAEEETVGRSDGEQTENVDTASTKTEDINQATEQLETVSRELLDEVFVFGGDLEVGREETVETSGEEETIEAIQKALAKSAPSTQTDNEVQLELTIVDPLLLAAGSSEETASSLTPAALALENVESGCIKGENEAERMFPFKIKITRPWTATVVKREKQDVHDEIVPRAPIVSALAPVESEERQETNSRKHRIHAANNTETVGKRMKTRLGSGAIPRAYYGSFADW